MELFSPISFTNFNDKIIKEIIIMLLSSYSNESLVSVNNLFESFYLLFINEMIRVGWKEK